MFFERLFEDTYENHKENNKKSRSFSDASQMSPQWEDMPLTCFLNERYASPDDSQMSPQ
jgi:hypothetical protein